MVPAPLSALSARLRAAAEVGTLAGAVDLLAEGADAREVVYGLLLALPLDVGDDDNDQGDEDGGELRRAEAVVGQLRGRCHLWSRRNGAGEGCPSGALPQVQGCLRHRHERRTKQLPEGDGHEGCKQEPTRGGGS